MRLLMAKTLTIALLLCPGMFGTDAPTFRGDPQHSGFYSSPAVTNFNRVKWKFHTKGMVFSSPAVVGGVVYVGSNDRNLYAIDLSSGTQKWKFATKGRITSSPAVANGLVYFVSYDSGLYAVSIADGTLRWKFQTGGERRYAGTHLHGSQPAAETMPDPFDFYLSSPVVWNGAVFFGSGDSYVYSLKATSGELKWKFKTGDVVHASPAIVDGKLYIGSWDSYFYALDSATGKELWRFKTGEDPDIHNQVGIQSSATVAAGIVYFGCRDSNLYALDAATGKKLWTFNNKGSWVIVSPVVQAGKLYFATSDTALLHIVDAKTGAPIDSLKFYWPIFSSPSVAGTTLYLAGQDGKLIAVDLTSFKPAWTFQSEGSRQNLAALSKPDGKPNYEAVFQSNFYDDMIVGVGKAHTVGTFLSSPVVSGSIVYIGSADGNLYAL